jgi:hypothetical protein
MEDAAWLADHLARPAVGKTVQDQIEYRERAVRILDALLTASKEAIARGEGAI